MLKVINESFKLICSIRTILIGPERRQVSSLLTRNKSGTFFLVDNKKTIPLLAA